MNKIALSLFLSISIIFLNSTKILAQNDLPSLLIEPTQINSIVNDTFTVDLIIDTANQEVAGVGAELFYNQNNLEVTKIDTYPIFDSYPNASYDNTKGTISISGIEDPTSQVLYNGKDRFATITFLSKSVGQSTIKFNYLPNNTRDSNIAVTYGTGDILAYTNSLIVSISPNTNSPNTVVDNPTFSPPENQTNNSNTLIYILGSIIIAILIIIITLFFFLKNKKPSPQEPNIVIKTNNQPLNPNSSAPTSPILDNPPPPIY